MGVALSLLIKAEDKLSALSVFSEIKNLIKTFISKKEENGQKR